MTNYLLSVLTAIRSVVNFCTSDTGSPVVKSVPAFDQDISALSDMEKAINLLIEKQGTKITGYTATRRTLRSTLTDVSYTHIRRGMAYAKKNDSVLFGILNYTLWSINRMKFG